MAKYRSIQTTFWSDSKVIDDFTPEDRYFYLYLLTNEKSNQLGCYELSIKQICRDTGYNEETVKKLLSRFENELQVINYDFKTKEIFLKNWYKYNWLNSENTKVCIDKEFNLVKSSILKELISPLYAPYNPLPSNKKKKNNKKNNKKNSERELSQSDKVTPTLPEIISYGSTIGASEEYCEKFYNTYEGVGWINANGIEIKNWKLVLNNWFKKDLDNGKTKDIRKRNIDPDRVLMDEEGRCYQENYDGTRYYI